MLIFGGKRKENYDDGDSYYCEEYNIDEYDDDRDEYDDDGNDDDDNFKGLHLTYFEQLVSLIKNNHFDLR